jgi:hypothetical protein
MIWLEAARTSQAGDGRSAAWISTDASPEGSQTLQTIADRLRGTMDDFGISLDEEAMVHRYLFCSGLYCTLFHKPA